LIHVLFWVCGCLCHVMICVPDPKICIYTDNVCNQQVFWISFLQFVWQAKYETLCVCSWWEKYIKLKYHVCKQHTVRLYFSFSEATFPSILQLLLIFFGTGLEVLRAIRIDSVNLNILRFPCIVSLFFTIQLHVLGNNCMLLLCILYFIWLFLHLRF